MAQFNRIVLSKSSDMPSYQLDNLNFRSLYFKEFDMQKDKGLLVVNFSLRKQMPILFVNNQIIKIIGSNKEAILGKSVNEIMP